MKEDFLALAKTYLSGREGVQPDGLASQQEETELIWGDHDNAAIPQG